MEQKNLIMQKNELSFDRRRFLKSSVLGASGLVAGVSGLKANSSFINKKDSNSQRFIYRTLGKTGLKLPIVSMGVMKSDNPNLVKAALEKGIIHFDTAHVYQGGRNEEMLGDLFEDFPRSSFTIATKVRPDGRDRKLGIYSEEATEKNFMDKFDISMERLKLDHVDILYHHSVSNRESALYEPVLNAMKKIKKSGRTKFLGISTHRNEPEVIEAAIESGVYEVVLTAYNFSQKHIPEMNKAIEKAAKAGLGIVAMKTMAGGFLDKERTQPVNTKAALKWAMQNPNVHTSIPGMTSFDQLDEDLSIMNDLELSDQESKDITIAQLHQGMYCTGCEECLPQCKNSLPVPDLMRAYMYTFGYRELKKGRDLLVSLDVPEYICTECGVCTVKCIKNFNIAQKVTDVSRLINVPIDFIS